MVLSGKRILVTGGAGFIGSNLVDHLVGENEVIVIDSLRTGKRENVNPSAEFHKLPIAKINEIEGRDIDVVFHLAAMASTQESFLKPDECIEINGAGTAKMLEFSRVNDIERFVFTSTAALYGNNPELPKRETMSIEILSPYAASKRAGEQLVDIYARSYGMKCYSLRLFNVFGPRQNPHNPYSGVISIFLDRAKRGETLYINGDGSHTRDFVFVNDAVRAFEHAAQGESEFGSAINISTGVETRIDQLARMIIEKVGSSSKIEFRDPKIGDVYRSYADNSKARRVLGWEPKFSFEQGLDTYLEWLTSHGQSYSERN